MAHSPVTWQVDGHCAAPFTMLRFEPDGRVTACCINSQYALGQAQTQSIREIWEGRQLAGLRDALNAADYSRGCLDCEQAHLSGHRADTIAPEFDRLVGPDLGRWPRRLEFALSNACNLQCVMCNGELSSAIRAKREHRPPLASAYSDAFFDELREFLPEVHEVAFLGGEPFLSTEAMRVWDLMIELDVRADTRVTTNATILNERVERYLHELRMNVSVSIDSVHAPTFESIRVGAELARTMANVQRMSSIARGYGGSLVVNACLMTSNWEGFPDLFRWAESMGCVVSVIDVVYPRQMSLVHADPEELRSAVERLAAQDADMRSELVVNRAAWDHMLARLRAAADAGPTAVPVALTPGTSTPAQDRLSQQLPALCESSGRTPVIIEVTDDIIVSTSDETWAAVLAMDELVGSNVIRLLPSLCERLAFTPRVWNEDLGGGLTSTVMEASGDGWTAEFTALMAEWESEGVRHMRIALTSSDLVDRATPEQRRSG